MDYQYYDEINDRKVYDYADYNSECLEEYIFKHVTPVVEKKVFKLLRESESRINAIIARNTNVKHNKRMKQSIRTLEHVHFYKSYDKHSSLNLLESIDKIIKAMKKLSGSLALSLEELTILIQQILELIINSIISALNNLYNEFAPPIIQNTYLRVERILC